MPVRDQDGDAISSSLIRRARDGDDTSWQRIVQVYRPRIAGWLAGRRIPLQEVEDLTQDVLAILVKSLPDFEVRDQAGGFRTWVRTITLNRARLYWRQGKYRVSAPGGDRLHRLLLRLEDPTGFAAGAWDREHDGVVLRHLLSSLNDQFDPVTLRVFSRLALDQASGKQVAAELGMTVTAVYNAKSRVLERLRRDAAGDLA